MKVAFIGLGTMGFPMAGHLQGQGLDLRVFNRNAQRGERWREAYSGHVATSIPEAVVVADMVALCLGADDDVRQVLGGDNGVFDNVAPGTIVVDHSTTSAALAREMAEQARARDLVFLDAPVSGGQAGAENGRLTIMVGGDADAFSRVKGVLSCYGANIRLVGQTGSGQLAKMVNQVCIAGVLQGLSEGLHLGQSLGMDMEAVVNVISAGAAQSWQMDNRASTMLAGEYDFGFAVDWMRKDLGYVLDEARRQKISLPLTALVDQFYAKVQSVGGGRLDTSSLLLALNNSEVKK